MTPVTETIRDYTAFSWELQFQGRGTVQAGDTMEFFVENAGGVELLNNKNVTLANGTVIGRITATNTVDKVLPQLNNVTNPGDAALVESIKQLDTNGPFLKTRYTITFNEKAAELSDLAFKVGVTNANTHVQKWTGTKQVERKLIVNGQTIARDEFTMGPSWVTTDPLNEVYYSPGSSWIVNKAEGLFGGGLGFNGHTGLNKGGLKKGDELRILIPENSSIRLKTLPVGTTFELTGQPVYNPNKKTANELLYVDVPPKPLPVKVVRSTETEYVLEALANADNTANPAIRYLNYYRTDTNDKSGTFTIVDASKVNTDTKQLTDVFYTTEVVRPSDGTVLSRHENKNVSIKVVGTDLNATGVVIPKAQVYKQFVDENGTELKPRVALFNEKKQAGTKFTITPDTIDGYDYLRSDRTSLSGIVSDTDQVVKLVYKKKAVNSNVNVLVVDEAGKTIRPTKTVFAEAKPEGTKYSVRKPRIAGYRFVRAEGELAGTLGKTDKTVKLVYKADSSVVAGTDPDTIEERKERVVPIPFETETRDNPELWQGEERVINPGTEGSKTITTTRQLDENQQPVGDPVVTENVTKQPVKRVIERGTKNPAGTETVTTEKPKPFKTVTRDNPDLYEGDERVVTEGKDGVTTVTTVYKTNKGKRTGDNPTVTETEKQPPVNRLVERGTKDPNGIDTVKEHEDVVYKTEYRDNPELYEGETRVIQEGELGSNVITKQYKTKKGKRTDEEPVVTKKTEKEPKNRIIERGTKPVAGVDRVVEDKEVPFKLVVKDNPELTEGEERVVSEGTPGLVKKTTAYKTEKGKRVGDPIVTETVVKEPIDRVVEKGTKPKTPKQTDADKNNPKGKDQTVFVGEKPDPKNSIDNYNDLPKGTVVKWEIIPDTATPGQKPSILLFEYPDGSIERVSVIVTAVPKPEPKDQTVFVGETPKAEDSIGNYPQLPEGTRVSWLVPPKTDKPGVVDGVVLIEYPDGRRVEVPVKVTVVEKEKEKQPPQQEQNNNSENGKNKDKVSDNSDNSDKDSNKDKPTPQGKDQTVRVGENPLVQDSIINHNDLPKGTKLSWEKTPDTTKPGVIEAVVLVEYPDGTSERVTVRVTVVDDSDKGKEKDNRENDNKTNPDTNTNNNQTPDKKELNQNKQPDRKESIKTGVGSVDQTATGVALTATALALSAFALRRRKQQ